MQGTIVGRQLPGLHLRQAFRCQGFAPANVLTWSGIDVGSRNATASLYSYLQELQLQGLHATWHAELEPQVDA